MYIRTSERSALGPLQYSLGDAAACTPDAVTNGTLCSFNSKNGGSTTAVYVPGPARNTDPLCLLVWIHGDLICGGEGNNAVSYVNSKAFPLAKQIAASKRPFVLVAPTMHWKGQHSHPLGSPQRMNAFLEEVRAGLTAAGWPSTPSFGRLILAGHSRAYAVLNGLAKGVSDVESSRGALATLTDVWLLDTTYGKNDKWRYCKDYLGWAKAKRDVNLRIFYIRDTDTAAVAECIRDEAPKAGLTNVKVKDFDPKALSHCPMPRVLMPDLLATAGNCPMRSNGPRTLRPMPSPAPSAPQPTSRPSNGSLFQRIQNALASGQWYLAMSLAVLAGDRDADRLTNMIFFARHPELKGRKLAATEPLFKQLSREWLDIRDRLVRPFLEKRTAGQLVTPSKPFVPSATPSKSKSCVQAGSCTACERRLHAAPPPKLQDVPAEFRYHKRGERLDTRALQAYQNMVRAARAEGIFSPYLKLASGFRDYDLQGKLWRGRLLEMFKTIGCSESSLPCIAFAIDRTTAALKSLPIPHPDGAWLTRFLTELRQGGCALDCDPKKAVQQLREGTAPPGKSPHHTGRAIDIHVGGKLSRNDKNVAYQRKQAAYQWLVCNAARFGFYPYNVEPWHWEYNPPPDVGSPRSLGGENWGRVNISKYLHHL
jgi:hypothetical protein